MNKQTLKLIAGVIIVLLLGTGYYQYKEWKAAQAQPESKQCTFSRMISKQGNKGESSPKSSPTTSNNTTHNNE